MPHLAPHARFVFAVKVQFDVRKRAGRRPVWFAVLPEVAPPTPALERFTRRVGDQMYLVVLNHSEVAQHLALTGGWVDETTGARVGDSYTIPPLASRVLLADPPPIARGTEAV